MTFKFRLLIAILLISLVFSVNTLAVRFYSVNSLFGISIREVNSVCEDDNGFIWASSKMGILRLTKFNYHIYQLPNESSDAFKVKLIYKNSKLYVFTNNGKVFYYNPVSDRFEFLANLSSALRKNGLLVFDLLIDDSDIWWFATSGGIYKYQSEKLEIAFQFSTDIHAITWYDKQNIVVAKQDGIWLLNTKSLETKCIFKNTTSFVFDFFTVFVDKNQNKLWLASRSNGLFLYDFDSQTCSRVLESVLPNQPILTIEPNSESTLLIGYDGQGIWELDRRSIKVRNVYKENLDDTYSLRGNGVYDLYCDKNSCVWICTYSGGLSFFDQASPSFDRINHQTNNVNSLVNNDVNSIVEDHRGKLWFATNNGISCWNPNLNQWKSFYNDQSNQAQVFLTLCEDNKGRIWAGTYSSGVYVLDGNTGKELAHYSKNGNESPLENDFILDIYNDREGDIWIGSLGGSVVCYDVNENKFRKYSKEFIGCFSELDGNKILLGCSTLLSVMDKQTGEVKRLVDGLLVHDLQVKGDDVWICTGGSGLVRYNLKSGETERFTTEIGLPSNFINGIIDTGDYLWLGTENGLCRFDPKDKSVVTYSSINWLSRVSFNNGSHVKLRNGQLAWGNNNGAIIFAPELINESPKKGKIFFQDLTISGRSIRDIPSFKLKSPIDSLKEVNLNYSQNTINLELIAVGQSSGTKFSWKMDGFDQDWRSPTGNSAITYTNLPSGHFTLKIKLHDSSLTNVLSERSIDINVVPPFWRTVWFIILVIIVVSAIAVLYFLFYINRLKQKHTEEKVRFFTNTAHDIRTSLTLIKAPVEELSKEPNLSDPGKYYLRLAIEQARRLSSVVTQLMDFQKVDIGKEQLALSRIDIVGLVSSRLLMLDSFAKSNRIDLVFNSDRESYITAVDESKMEKIVDNLISNAVKYSHGDNHVQINLKCDDKKWMLQVKDHGIGISAEAQRQLFKEFYRGENAINSKVVGSGIGLLLVQNYVTMHGGDISCISQENVGSTFQVVIPYRELSKETNAVNPILKSESTFPKELDIALQTPEMEENSDKKDLSILIVEDNDDLRNFISTALCSEFNVSTAEDGVKAWEIVQKQIPNMVVSDVMMPNMDGFELCELIKSNYKTSHVPVILLTALSEKAEQLLGLGLGADDYLTKPFDMSILIQRIKTIIRNREVVREKVFKLLNGNTAETTILDNKLNDNFLKKILEVAQANISNSEFSKDEFASSVNMSSSLLYKKTKSLTGLSPTDFIKTIRLEHALELLQSRKYTVTEVSELCGFASVGYFSTVFRKHFGKSPTEILE